MHFLYNSILSWTVFDTAQHTGQTDRQTDRTGNNKIIGDQRRGEETQSSCWHKALNSIPESIHKKQSIKSTKPIDNWPSWVLLIDLLAIFPSTWRLFIHVNQQNLTRKIT